MHDRRAHSKFSSIKFPNRQASLMIGEEEKQGESLFDAFSENSIDDADFISPRHELHKKIYRKQQQRYKL